MSRKRITISENSVSLPLPQELLDAMGIADGDEVDISVVDRTVILRPIDDSERARTIEDVTNSVFERRKSAYEELAKGVE